MESIFAQIAMFIFSAAALFFGYNYTNSSWTEAQFQSAIHGKIGEDFWPGGLLLAAGLMGMGFVFNKIMWATWPIVIIGAIAYAFTSYDLIQGYFFKRKELARESDAYKKWQTKKIRNHAIVAVIILIGFASALFYLILRVLS